LLPFIDGLMRRKGTEILREESDNEILQKEGEERRDNEKNNKKYISSFLIGKTKCHELQKHCTIQKLGRSLSIYCS
jgi:hypothetical protein